MESGAAGAWAQAAVTSKPAKRKGLNFIHASLLRRSIHPRMTIAKSRLWQKRLDSKNQQTMELNRAITAVVSGPNEGLGSD